MTQRKIGKPSKSETKYYKDKLKWFRIARYKRAVANELSPCEWYEQIVIRRGILEQIKLVPDYCTPREFHENDYGDLSFTWYIDLIAKNPILRFSDFRGYLDETKMTYDRTLPRLNSLPAYLTTIDEFYLWEASASRTLVRQARKFFDELMKIALLKSGSEHGTSPFLSTLQKAFWERKIDLREPYEAYRYDGRRGMSQKYSQEFANPIKAPRVLGKKAFITIDLNASNTAIHDRIEKMLPMLRGNAKTVCESSLSTSSWARSGLLPYADLQIWRLINGLPKPDEDVEQLPASIFRELIYDPYKKSGLKVPTMTATHYKNVFLCSNPDFSQLIVMLTEQIEDAVRLQSALREKGQKAN